jgi:hypothetical protein
VELCAELRAAGELHEGRTGLEATVEFDRENRTTNAGDLEEPQLDDGFDLASLLGTDITREAYLESSSEFGKAWEEAISSALPTGKARTGFGIHAAVVDLSKRLAQLSEDYFSGFVQRIDEMGKRHCENGSNAGVIQAWRRAVIDEHASTLWRDIRDAWASCLDHVREVTAGASFGARIRAASDREAVILASNEQRMSETLDKIAQRYSLSEEAVRKLRIRKGRDIVLQLVDPNRPEDAIELRRSYPLPTSREQEVLMGLALDDSEQNKSHSEPTSASLELSNWGKLDIRFLSEERVQIEFGKSTETRNYAEFGFEDGRTKAPNLAWVTLRTLAEMGGTIKRPAGGQDWHTVEKRMQEIRKVFRGRFKLSADPVPFMEGVGYRALFKITCAPSFKS